MKTVLLTLLIIGGLISPAFSQDVNSIRQADEAENSIQKNKHFVFARTPVITNRPGNASQSFKGDDFIYARVFFEQPLKEVLFLEKNDENFIPADIFVEDITNHHSLYISLDLTEEEMSKTFFDFDILPEPGHSLRAGKEFETGRFSFFVTESSLENRHPVFKFTIGDATGYIQIDYSGINLQQVKARDFEAYEKAHHVKDGEEKQ
jgi:hypothetical protein